MTVRLGIALVLLASAGCGGPQTGSVTGSVTWNGKPIAMGLITFVPEKGEPRSAGIRDGKYETGEIPTGEYRLTVALSTGMGAPPPKQPAGTVGEGLGGGDLTAPKKTARAAELSKQYGDPKTSGLSFTVKPGPNTFDVPDLK